MHMTRITGLVLTAITCAQTVRAQETRHEQIAGLQEEKAIHLGHEGPGRGEQLVVRIMNSPLLAGTGGFFPWFGSVYEGTKFGFGAGYLRRLPRSSRLTTLGGVSINRSTLLRADYVAPRLLDGRIEPYASVRWARAHDVSFYGVGNESPGTGRAGFDFDPAVVSAGFAYLPDDRLRVTVGYESIGFETRVNGSAIPPPTLESLSHGRRLRFNGTHVGVAFDTRPSPAYSTRGTALGLSTSYFSEAHDQPFELRQTEFEAVQLVPLVREQFVLAFRGLATFTDPDAGNGAPLAMLPYIGSGTTLRGFANRRFVDRDRLVLTAEYRWRPSRFIDLALFMDAGQVAPVVEAFAWGRMKTSVGIGARFHGPSFSALRMELAHSVEGYRLVFTTGSPF